MCADMQKQEVYVYKLEQQYGTCENIRRIVEIMQIIRTLAETFHNKKQSCKNMHKRENCYNNPNHSKTYRKHT